MLMIRDPEQPTFIFSLSPVLSWLNMVGCLGGGSLYLNPLPALLWAPSVQRGTPWILSSYYFRVKRSEVTLHCFTGWLENNNVVRESLSLWSHWSIIYLWLSNTASIKPVSKLFPWINNSLNSMTNKWKNLSFFLIVNALCSSVNTKGLDLKYVDMDSDYVPGEMF